MENMSAKIVTKDVLIKRLRRIEGQVAGIQRMVEQDKQCSDILIQVSAVRAAINKVGSMILEKHSITCITNATSAEDKGQAIQDLTKTVQGFLKFIS